MPRALFPNAIRTTIQTEADGRRYAVSEYLDDDQTPPWDRHDGHAPVRLADRFDKRPGERVLASTGSSAHLYDWQAACKIARTEGWDTDPIGAPNRVERAVQADFDRMRAFARGELFWIIVAVVELDADDRTMSDEYDHARGGIESDLTDDNVAEVVGQLICDIECERERHAYPVSCLGV